MVVRPLFATIFPIGQVTPAQAVVAKWLDTFKEFPIRQRPASFSLDEVMRKLQPSGAQD
jgi:hypothetical protein